MKSQKKIIIDTDPGGDDALAITMALKDSKTRILGVVTTYGNVSLEKTTANTLRVLDYFGAQDIPVVKGSSKPLMGKAVTAEDFHGKDGLGDTSIPFSKRKENPIDAVSFYRKIITDNEIDIIALGPLTNIAKLIILEPEIIKKIKTIYIMGGTFRVQTVNKFEEFNFFNDPLAVKIVLSSPITKYLVPLDVTNKILLNEKEIQLLRRMDTKGTELLYMISRFWEKNLSLREPFIPWDSVAIGSFFKPELYSFKKIALDIDLGNIATKGKLISRKIGEKTTFVATDVDVKKFLQFFADLLSRN